MNYNDINFIPLPNYPINTSKQNNANIVKIIDYKIDKAKKDKTYMRSVYHYIHNKYWSLSVAVIFLSSILTIIESIKLIFTDTKNKYLNTIDNSTSYIEGGNKIIYTITKHDLDWNLSCDVLALIIGSSITIIMSLIRFNKYQVKLEIVSKRLMQLTNYKTNIKMLKYKVTNGSNYDIDDINKEIIKLDENNRTDCELNKIISHNKEHELKYNNDKLINDGYPQNKCLYLIKKYLCCELRIK